MPCHGMECFDFEEKVGEHMVMFVNNRSRIQQLDVSDVSGVGDGGGTTRQAFAALGPEAISLPPKVHGLLELDGMRSRLQERAPGISFFVPPFVLVTVQDILGDHLPPTSVEDLLRGTCPNPEAVAEDALKAVGGEALAALRSRFQVAAKWLVARESHQGKKATFIRSAGPHEDGTRFSFAGSYETRKLLAETSIEDLVAAAIDIAISPYRQKGLRYHHWNGIPVEPIPVIFHEGVPNETRLNITVTPAGITTVLVSRDGYDDVVFECWEDGSGTLSIGARTHKEFWQSRPLQGILEDLVKRLDPAFRELVLDGERISIEVAFDQDRLNSEGKVVELANLQKRVLPKPPPVQLDPVWQSREVPGNVRTHLIPGPCTFDCVVSIRDKREAFYEALGLELTAVINFLRAQGFTRPLLVLAEGTTEAATTKGSKFQDVIRVASELPFVGVIDASSHSEWVRDLPGLLAGHLGALVGERHEIVVNAPGFLNWFRDELAHQSGPETISPTALDLALSSDFRSLETVEWLFDEPDETYAGPEDFNSDYFSKYGLTSEVFLLSGGPLTVEVVESGGAASGAKEQGQKQHQLKISTHRAS